MSRRRMSPARVRCSRAARTAGCARDGNDRRAPGRRARSTRSPTRSADRSLLGVGTTLGCAVAWCGLIVASGRLVRASSRARCALLYELLVASQAPLACAHASRESAPAAAVDRDRDARCRSKRGPPARLARSRSLNALYKGFSMRSFCVRTLCATLACAFFACALPARALTGSSIAGHRRRRGVGSGALRRDGSHRETSHVRRPTHTARFVFRGRRAGDVPARSRAQGYQPALSTPVTVGTHGTVRTTLAIAACHRATCTSSP